MRRLQTSVSLVWPRRCPFWGYAPTNRPGRPVEVYQRKQPVSEGGRPPGMAFGLPRTGSAGSRPPTQPLARGSAIWVRQRDRPLVHFEKLTVTLVHLDR